MLGILIIAQILLKPLAIYILTVAKWISGAMT